jgi:hypothetical protein
MTASYRNRSDHGQPNFRCHSCKVVFWHGERVRALHGSCAIIYNNCCKGGNVSIPSYRPRPEPLSSLVLFDGNSLTKKVYEKYKTI